MKNKFLITGGSGFLGSSLARRLVTEGEDVSILVRKDADNWRLKDIIDKISVYSLDILDKELGEIVKRINPDYVFHFASYGVFSSQNDIDKIIDINIKGTLNLINSIKEAGCKMFINAGSATEYGIKENPLKEDDLIMPVFNDYAVAKAATTLFVQKEAFRNNLPFVTFRIFTPYGPYEDKNRLIPYVVFQAMNNLPIKLTSPKNVRDFIFIDDLVEAYLLAIKSSVSGGEIINIGSGEQHTIQEIVNIAVDLTGGKSEVIWGSSEIQAKEIEPKVWTADISKAKKILNWQPKITLMEGMRQVFNFMESNKDR